MMVAAGEEVAEFMCKKDGKQRESKRKTCNETRGILVEELEGSEKFVKGTGIVLGIGHRELRASNEAGAEGQKKEHAGEEKGFERETARCSCVLRFAGRNRLPINAGRDGWGSVFWNLRGHEVFKADGKSALTSTT